MSKILKVKARQVFDSRGNPTVEAEVYIKNNSATAICPSGASTGTYEAFEKRDKNNKSYLGKSVLSAVNLVNTKISNKLKGQSVHNQERIDALLINLDGTRQKTNLGANAMLAVSMAAKKLSAKVKKLPLYKTFFLNNSFAATSKQIETSLPFTNPDFFIALTIKSRAWLLLLIMGAKPPSSPTEVDNPLAFINFDKFLITIKHILIASEKLLARSGLIINSWILRPLLA